ncbi:MAG: hypothetical protein KBS70_07890 [Bacteroidales bacterium]|nr:hypothetical protein [Candidatus Colicola equi]
MKKLTILFALLTLCAGLWAIDGVKYIDAAGVEQTANNVTEITNASTTLTAGWYVVLGKNVQVGTLVCQGEVHLILADGAKLGAAAGDYNPGIEVSDEGNSLTIYGQTKQTGILNANGGRAAAGIGGRCYRDGSNITINGGVITAKGGGGDMFEDTEAGAGIGAGGEGKGFNITINRGKVYASSKSSGGTTPAKGIGSGYDGPSPENIIIGGGNSVWGGPDKNSATKIKNVSTQEDFAKDLGYVYVEITSFPTVGEQFSDAQSELTYETISMGTDTATVKVVAKDTYTNTYYVIPSVVLYNRIPCVITQIEENAFSSATGLTNITVLPITPPTLGANAFGDAKLEVIRVSRTTGEAYKSAEGWSQYADIIDDRLHYMDGDWNIQYVTNDITILQTAVERKTLTAGWYIVHGEVFFYNGIACSGDVHLILADGAKLTATGANNQAGIEVSGEGNSLTIYGQANQAGQLIVTGGHSSAGIGGNHYQSGSNIAIYGGNSNLTGGEYNGHIYSAIGSGSDCDVLTTNVSVATNLLVKVGNSTPPSKVISHTTTDNIAGAFAGLSYATIVPIQPISYIDAEGKEQTCANYVVVGNGSEPVTWEAGWYAITGVDVTLSQGAICNGDVHLILADGAKLTATGANNQAGIQVSGEGNSLTIYGQKNYTGKLTATGGETADGIGGNSENPASNIVVAEGFNVKADSYNPPASSIEHTSTTNIANALSGKQYAVIEAQTPVPYIDADGNEQNCGVYAIVTSSDAIVTWHEGWYVVQGVVNLSQGAVCKGNVHLILADEAQLTITGRVTDPGIFVFGEDNSITIYGQKNYTGKLTATGGAGTDGIGGKIGIPASNIFVAEGFNVMADSYTPPTSLIEHTSTTNIANALSGKQYAVIETQTPVPYIDAEGNEQNCPAYTIVTSSDAPVTWHEGWYVVPAGSDINIRSGIICEGNIHLILADEAQLTITQAIMFGSGIFVSGEGNSLTIYGQKNYTGKLTATGGELGDAIGGNSEKPASNIFVAEGFNVMADSYTPPTSLIEHTSTTDISSALSGKQYAVIATQTPIPYIDADGNEQNCTLYATVAGSEELVTWHEGWYVVPADSAISIPQGIVCEGNVHLILSDNSQLWAIGLDNQAGIQVAGEGNSLTIYGQKNYTGKLTAVGGNNAVGIGGNSEKPASNIFVTEGLTIKAGDGKSVSGIIEHSLTTDIADKLADKKVVQIVKTYTTSYIDVDGKEQTQNTISLVNSAYESVMYAGWYVATDTIALPGGTTCMGEVHLILADGTKVSSRGGDEKAGVRVSGEGNSLTIYGQTAQTGKLEAYAGMMAAGIGGGNGEPGSNITINGGVIYAEGGAEKVGWSETGRGAGIGGGCGGDGSHITINRGSVKACSVADNHGAPIGGGYGASGSNVFISGYCSVLVSDDLYPRNAVTHTSTTDLASILAGSQSVSANYLQNIPYIDENGEEKTCSDFSMLASLDGPNVLNAGWYLAEGTVTLPQGAECNGDVHIVLLNNGIVTATGAEEHAAIRVSGEGNSLTIYGQKEQLGKLTVNGGKHAAGIGGSNGENGSYITINGGIITTTGGDCGAAIGGGCEGAGSHITINGGTITAVGGYGQLGGWFGGAGIGGGLHGAGSEIIIKGGTVTATGGMSASGIGGAHKGAGSNITIDGGMVTATGGESAVAIGAGASADCSGVYINGGTVTLCGGEDAGCIGATRTNTSSQVFVSEDCALLADQVNPPTKTIYHRTEDDLADILRQNQFAKIYKRDPIAYIDIDGTEKETRFYSILESADTLVTIDTVTTITPWFVVTDTVTFSKGAVCKGAVRLLLTDSAQLTSHIRVVGNDNSLSIYGQKNQTGLLIANGGTGEAGIGGTSSENGSYITINGGTINATGGANGAGIGGGDMTIGSYITINNGIVTAVGGDKAAGIGGGYSATGAHITINGGTINATGGAGAAGIGGSQTGNGMDITIIGGTITATGGDNASGIGGGKSGVGSDIYVEDICLVLADTVNPPKTEIKHSFTEDIAPQLAAKQYVIIKKDQVITDIDRIWEIGDKQPIDYFKVIINGQLFIRKNGKTYNALGVER